MTVYRILLALEGGNDNEKGDIEETITSLPIEGDGVEVTVLNVFEEFDAIDEGGEISSEELYDPTELPQQVTDAATAFEATGLTVETRREHGDPTESILSVANEIDADMIALGGRKQTPVGKVIFGSTTQSVLLGADRPVLVVMG